METLNILLGLERMLYNITLRSCDEEVIKEAKELIQKQGERLADYEGTGLEPATIKAAADAKNGILTLASLSLDTTAGRLRELVQSDRDGRLVVMPCTVGDTVYVIGDRLCRACTIDEAYISDSKDVEYLVSFDCDSDCNGCPFNDWHQDYTGEYSCNGEFGNAAVKSSQFGKTVFLTREEAERCLD